MALTYTIDSPLRLVRCDLGPEVPPFPDVRRLLDTLSADPLFRPGLTVLLEAGHLYLSRTYQRDGLLLLASRLALNSDVRRWALLTSNLGTYRDRQIVEVYAEGLGIDYRVFARRRDAMNWVLSLTGVRSA